MNQITIDTEKLLSSFKIDATPVRTGVLEILAGRPDIEFTYAEILAQVKAGKLSVSDRAVTSTLRLFKVRNVITELPVHISPGRKRGRPEAKFVYAQSC